ncbi:MAG: dephospho-CoA kinase [Chloroflexales bacterium]|nr:dephospho-CoA kinase [Chloroflexales bacterium]
MKPFLIGLTGGIACGKSTVLAMLAALGARIIDADRVTHRVQQPGAPAFQQIVAAFGAGVLSPNGALDRRKLGAIVFSDPAKLRQLELLVHPAVRAEIWAFIEEVGRAGGYGTRLGALRRPVVVIDAIKLIESGWVSECAQVWVVTCPEEQQVERLRTTRGMSEAEARQRIAAQAPQASRLPYATVVIDNGGSQAETRAQVDAAWQTVLGAVSVG